MAALSDREIKAISDSISLDVRKILEAHEAKMQESSREAREATVETITGFPWDKRHYVREGIQWAVEQKATHNRRRVAFWGALMVVAVSQGWEHVAGFFNGGPGQ